jgi:hypothetical protein
MYAIGEIVLVMIGILLALSVSNWNTNRLESETNTRLLKKLDNELQLNIDRLSFLKNHKSGYISRLQRSDSLETILTNGITPNDLEKVIRGFYISNALNLYTSTYEEMKNTGRLYKLGSDTLLDKIETYYKLCDRENYYVIEINEEIESHIRSDMNKGWFKVQQDFYAFGKETTIKDNSWLFNSQSNEYKEFTRQVSYTNFYLRNVLNRVNWLIEASEKLQESIHKELKE